MTARAWRAYRLLTDRQRRRLRAAALMSGERYNDLLERVERHIAKARAELPHAVERGVSEVVSDIADMK